MKTFSVLYNRDFSPMEHPPLQAQSCCWTFEGGADRAVLTSSDQHTPFTAWQDLLRCPVGVYNANGSLVWWGYVNAVRQDLGDCSLTCSLDGLANRVAVAYTSLRTNDGYGEPQQTAWFEDAASQAMFGVKELVIAQGMIPADKAEQLALAALQEKKRPQVGCLPAADGLRLGGGSGLLGGGSGLLGGGSGVRLDCLGWIHSLAWRVYPAPAGVVGNTPAMSLSVAAYQSNTQTYVDQSFVPQVSGSLVLVQLRARSVGASDSLRVTLRADNAGLPGTVLAYGDWVPAAQLGSSTYPWVDFAFSSPVSVSAGSKYWLQVNRSVYNTSGTQYYMLGADAYQHYADGEAATYSHAASAWTVPQPYDLLFKTYIQKDIGEQLGDVYLAGAQFFNGLALEAPMGSTATPYARRAVSCLEAFLDLLHLGAASGSGYGVEVTPNRLLRVFSQPQAPGGLLWAADGGQWKAGQSGLSDLYGNPLELGRNPAGQWVQFGEMGAAFIRRACLDVLESRLKLAG